MNKLNIIGITALIFIAFAFSVNAGNQSQLFNNATIIYHPWNVSQDNSTYKRTAVVVGTPLFDATRNSTNFDGASTSHLDWAASPQFTTMLNYSCWAWSNYTTGKNRVNWFWGNRINAVNGEFTWGYDDRSSQQNFIGTTWCSAGSIANTPASTAFSATNNYDLVVMSVTHNSTTLQTQIIYLNQTKLGTGTCAANRAALLNQIISFGDNGLNDNAEGYTGGMKGAGCMNGTITEEQVKYLHEKGEDFKLIDEVAVTLDTSKPIGNTSFNISSIKINDVINFTSNVTDETALLYANWTINFTSKLFFNYSFPASTTKAEVSNSTKITCGRGCVLNFTLDVTDTSGNFWQNSTLFTVADTLGTIQIGLNISTIRINDVLNISGNITEPDGNIAYGWVVDNRTGTNINYSFTGSGSQFNFSQAIIINVSRGNVINFTVFYNDTYNTLVQNSTLLTISPTTLQAPAIINPTANTLYNTQPLHLNITFPAIADTDDAFTSVSWWVNGTLNQTILISGGNTGNTTFNASDGKYNISVSYCNSFNCSPNSTIESFKIDLTTPTDNLTAGFPNLTFINRNTNMTIGAVDTNLEGHNVTCGVGEFVSNQRFSAENTGITANVNNIKIEINTSWGDGLYTCVSNQSDDHTAKEIPDYALTKDIATLELSYGVNGDNIKVKLKKSDIGLLNFYTYKKIDRYVFVFNFSNTSVTETQHNYTFKTSSNNYKLRLRTGSNYPSHFITPFNWVDYSLKSSYPAVYEITEVPSGSGKYETKITTKETTLVFESIGGRNKGSSRTQLEIDTGIPQIHNFNASKGNILPNSSFYSGAFVNFTYNLSDKNNANFTLHIGGKINTSLTYINNITSNISINLSDGEYLITIEVMDNATNKINKTLNITIDSTNPSVTQILNRTLANLTEITTDTDVNITFLVREFNMENRTISINFTKSWKNYTPQCPIGNGTCFYAIGKTNFTAGQVVGHQIWVNDSAGNYFGESPPPIHTFTIGGIASASSPPSSSDGGGGGGAIGATRQCKEYSQTYKTCYYFDGINQCLKGCPKGQSCNATYECFGAITQQTTTTQSTLNPITSPISGFFELKPLRQAFNWFKGLIGLSRKNPELSVYGGSALASTTPQQDFQQILESAKENTKQLFNQHKWLPYAIIGIVIAGFAIYAFGLYVPIWALLMSMGLWGYIIIMVVIIILYMFIKYF